MTCKTQLMRVCVCVSKHFAEVGPAVYWFKAIPNLVKKKQSFNHVVRRVKTMDAMAWLCLALSELAENKIIAVLFLDLCFSLFLTLHIPVG